MHRPFLLCLFAAACTTPADPVTDDTDVVVRTSCESDLQLDFPGGETAPIPCVSFQLGATMEFDPDDPPELRTMDLKIDGSSSSGFECSVVIQIHGVCGADEYWMGDAVSAQAVSLDCEGTPDRYEGTLSGEDGAITLTHISTTDQVGNLTGVLVPVRVAGEANVTLTDNVKLTGTFMVEGSEIGEDAEEQACATTGPSEPDPITGGTLYGSADGREYQYDLRLGGGLPPTGCPRCDVAGRLQLHALSGQPWIDQTNELLVVGVRKSTGVAWVQDEGTGNWTKWGEGAAGGGSWSGARTTVVGGHSTYETLDLTW